MKMKFVLTIGLLSFVTLAFAQPKAVVKANEAFAKEQYSDAANLCKEAYQKLTRKGPKAQKKKGDMAFKTAECYRLTERFRDANEWYDRAILLEYEQIVPQVYLYNAEMLRMMREYDKAIENYKKYKALVPEDERGSIGIQSCESNKDYIANKGREIIENQTTINKKVFDMAPMFGDRKLKKLYFSSSREGSTGKDTDPRSGENFMDIWVTDIDKKGNFTEPYLVKGEAINTVDNEGTVCFDDRKKKMFFTRCPNIKKQNLGCDIWVADAKGKTEWKEPKKIGLKAHDSISVGHPCTKDGKFLIFASDMPGGYGGRDLWYSTYDRKADTWTAPRNMGPEINTKGNELFPTFAMNGDLFYASDGMAGLGGLDIFRATAVAGAENKWENPQNIGAPINGENNDYAIIEMDEKKGYFTSERKSINGEYVPDIYSYELPPNLFSLKVIVSDLGEIGKKIEDCKVTVNGSDGTTWEGYTDESGQVYWDKRPAGDRYINEEASYTMNISKEGYYENPKPSSISTIDLKYDQDFVVDMGLFPKRPIRLPEVRYHLNKWTFVVDSTINSPDSLLFVYDLLNERPELVLELSSHTDSRGSNKRNQTLSENRARACYKFLVEQKGIDPRRIVPVGKGENDPRKVWLKDDVYYVSQPSGESEEIILTEAYINKYRRDRKKFEMLHQLNRRTEGAVYSLEFDDATAPAADKKYLEYLPYR